MGVGVVLALLAAAANATASVLQRKAARGEPDKRAFSLRLVWDLAHRPVWIAGIATVLVGFLLQAVALGQGAISLVQPLLVLELPFTLMLASRVLGGRLNRREWTAIGCMALGLALMLYGLAPVGANPAEVGLPTWVTGMVATAIIVALLVIIARRGRTATRAGLLGIATGITFGLTAVLLKDMTAAYAEGGIDSVFTTWQTYLVITIGPTGFFLLQNALQAGSLVASQPGMTLANPATAIAWGVAVLGDNVRGGGWLVLTFGGAGLIAVGSLLLSSSPLFHHHHGHPPPTRGRWPHR